VALGLNNIMQQWPPLPPQPQPQHGEWGVAKAGTFGNSRGLGHQRGWRQTALQWLLQQRYLLNPATPAAAEVVGTAEGWAICQLVWLKHRCCTACPCPTYFGAYLDVSRVSYGLPRIIRIYFWRIDVSSIYGLKTSCSAEVSKPVTPATAGTAEG
jgi:hypothetical protein